MKRNVLQEFVAYSRIYVKDIRQGVVALPLEFTDAAYRDGVRFVAAPEDLENVGQWATKPGRMSDQSRHQSYGLFALATLLMQNKSPIVLAICGASR